MASLESKYNAHYNCYNCLNKYKGRAQYEMRTRRNQTNKQCFTPGDISKNLEHFKFTKCIGNFTTTSLNYYIESFFAYEKGLLPMKGTLGEMPNKLMDIFKIISTVRAEKQTEENAKK